jgi:hypothetical protein
MFTTKCFIRKNTPELQDKLKKLGYRVCICCQFKDNIWLNNFLTIKNDPSIHGIGVWDIEDSQEEALNSYLSANANRLNPSIDCGENEELFLALAALRDDKPDYQWFVWDDDEVAYNKFKQYIPGEPWEEWWWFEVHKASVEELIEHFKV